MCINLYLAVDQRGKKNVNNRQQRLTRKKRPVGGEISFFPREEREKPEEKKIKQVNFEVL